MNKKLLTAVALAGVLSFGVGIGTQAAYRKAINSNNNTIISAKFNVDLHNSKGTFTDNAFVVVGKDLKPGTLDKYIYEFQVTKDTEVDTEYQVALKNEGDLFKAGTPVSVTLQQIIDNNWKNVDLTSKIKPTSNTDSFRLLINWPMETAGVNDIDFAGKEGKIGITFTASQVTTSSVVTNIKSDYHKVEASHLQFKWNDKFNNFYKPLTIEYYKLDNVKTLYIGNVLIDEGINQFNHLNQYFDVKNLVLTNIPGSNNYMASCIGIWDKQIFTYKFTDNGDLNNISYADFKISSGELTGNNFRLQANNKLAGWFNN